jgi:exosortase
LATAIAVSNQEGTRRWARLGWVALSVCTALVYGRTFVTLARDWWTDDNYSHGLLVPFAIGFLIYQESPRWRQLQHRPSWIGSLLILFSQVVGLAGYLGAEYFLQRVSFAFFVCGVILFLYGWRQLREVALILLLFLLAVPLPAIVFNQVALPLQLIASMVSEKVLTVLNIPVFREGNILALPNITLSVAEACSGIRSLMSLITLAVMIAYFLPVRWLWRCLFVFSAVPVAIFANSMRVAGTGILARHWGEAAAQGFFHSFSGWLIFVFAMIILGIEAGIFVKLQRQEAVSIK